VLLESLEGVCCAHTGTTSAAANGSVNRNLLVMIKFLRSIGGASELRSSLPETARRAPSDTWEQVAFVPLVIK